MNNVIFVFKTSLLIILQSYSLTVLPQQPHDYQLFRQDATYYYHQSDEWDGAFVAIRLDSSVVTGEGTEWYNHNSVVDANTDPFAGWCFRPNGPSWMGYKLLVKPNGDNLLYGINNNDVGNILYDTLIIKTRAMPGDSWTYFHAGTFIGSDTIATVIRADTMNFMGITDSIKVIDLGVDSIILSKSHGLVRALSFRDFFLNEANYFSFELAGITSADTVIGRKLLTNGNIFDYEIGDVFHRRTIVEGGSYPDVYDVLEVLDKYYSADQDTVFYQMSKIEWWYYIGGLAEINFDTLTEAHYDLDDVLYNGKFPTETIWFPDSSSVYSYELYYYDDTFNGRMLYYGPYEIYPAPFAPDTCFDMMGTDFTSYIEGCGSYIHYYGDYHNCMPCQMLDYFKKGDEEWGTPYEIPVGIGESVLCGLKIYPNPVVDDLCIKFSDRSGIDVLVKILSIDGRLHFSQNYSLNSTDNILLNFSGFSKGIYFVNISGTGYSESFKILKNY